MYYLVTDPLGWTHRVLVDKTGIWGHENIMHFLDVSREERRVFLDHFLGDMLASTKDSEDYVYYGLKWAKELV